MASYKQPTFQERAALAAQAKQAALEKLRTKPPVDEGVAAERRAAALAKEQALAEASAAKKAAREAEKAAKAQAAADKKAREEAEAAAAAAAAEAAKPRMPVIPTAAELKAARDARYAARKARNNR